MRALMCVHVGARARGHVLAHTVRACSLAKTAFNAYAPYFSNLFHKRCDFQEKIIERKMCFDFLYSVCLKDFPFKEEFSEISSKMSNRFHVKYPLFLSDFNGT